jgi:hypothetical protein
MQEGAGGGKAGVANSMSELGARSMSRLRGGAEFEICSTAGMFVASKVREVDVLVPESSSRTH